ncbi:hypothetical protein RP726_18740 [Candidatus Methylospira mobilis]|uniref:hypothetical protein n=1 Tax=Candidatus Methylospira mobilis TaxID=1808979 RepID=UPI001D172A12|nr:hypothetical protein [Candidatus Methylospira mobilis]WNV04412.1 hypothetical protein RP726_18740 [Candidatus Methylospira mobilis]
MTKGAQDTLIPLFSNIVDVQVVYIQVSDGEKSELSRKMPFLHLFSTEQVK